VRVEAAKFVSSIEGKWPDLFAEMKGIADGASADEEIKFIDIIALNVRTEIAFGLFSDGCTAFAWKTRETCLLAQNWDWSADQRGNIVQLDIEQNGKPNISMMTEAGIVGKIGLNSAGVGVTLNAIRALGVAYEKLPVHLALRMVLDSQSKDEAADALRRFGVAAAAHIQIADKTTGAVGFECTSADIVELEMDGAGVCTHSNHLTKLHAVEDKGLLVDSPPRLQRIGQLLKEVETPTIQSLAELLKDEEGYPTSINRAQTEKAAIETLFSIVMDLGQGKAIVKMGRPTEGGEILELRA
jgi:isopenicillin-N N-acyltransferase like protein